MNLLKWLFGFGTFSMGGGGGGDGGAGARQEEEERRKQLLRSRIDRLYGIDTAAPEARRTPRNLTAQYDTQQNSEGASRNLSGYRDESDGAMYAPIYENDRESGQRLVGFTGPNGQRVGTRTLSSNDPENPQGEVIPDLPDLVEQFNLPESQAARSAMEGEKTKLAEATRGHYADQLSRAHEKAERNARFNLARRSVLGGSSEIDTMSELSTDRNLGATRVDDAVRRAVAGLESAREQERLNAIQLVNSGAGDSAVSAAQRGLQNSFENQASAQRVDLTSDLFTAGANSLTASNLVDRDALLAARLRDRTAAFVNAGRTSSGRVTPSS